MTLVHQGKVASRHGPAMRCSEDDVGRPRGNTCSIWVACGVRSHTRRIFERELELVVTNGEVGRLFAGAPP